MIVQEPCEYSLLEGVSHGFNVKPKKKRKNMGVKLREKKLKNGQLSFYLDIYHNKRRWYEFLEIHIQKGKLLQEDKDKKRLAQEIRAKREHELIVDDNGLIDKRKKQACLIQFFEQYMQDGHNLTVNQGMLYQLKIFTDNKAFPFSKLSPYWFKELEKFLLGRVSNNSAQRYINSLISVINEAVRRKIITRNPYYDIPPSQKLRIQEVFRNAFTIEQLQHLANIPVKDETEKQIRQAYFFSCFTGLRWSDINPLRWDEIIVKEIEGQQQWFLYFEQEKTKGIEYLPLSNNAIDILKERKKKQEEEIIGADKELQEKQNKESPYVFPTLKEEEGKNVKYQNVRAALKKWAKAAGIDEKKLHFHSGRHTFATNVLESSPEGDLYTVSKLLGHKSIQSTQVYAKVRDRRKLAAVKALPKISFGF